MAKFKSLSDTLLQAGSDDQIGSVRIERGRKHNPDGSASDQEVWRVYVFSEPQDQHKARLQLDPNAPAVGEPTVPGVWLVKGEHSTLDAAQKAADKLA